MNKPELPPNLTRLRIPRDRNEEERQHQRRERWNAYRELEVEHRKKAEARRKSVEEAIASLPLKAEAATSGMADLFEQTLYAAEAKLKRPKATSIRVERELKLFAGRLGKLVQYLESMHRDTLTFWAQTGGTADAAINVAALALILGEANDWAARSLAVMKKANRDSERGRRTDPKAKAMRETAEFVYERSTNRKANIAYDAYAGQEIETEFVAFLERIYEIYGVKASAKSRARKRGRMAKK